MTGVQKSIFVFVFLDFGFVLGKKPNPISLQHKYVYEGYCKP